MATDDRQVAARGPLRRMQAPAHRDGFWEDLDHALRAEARRTPPIQVAERATLDAPPLRPRPPAGPPRPSNRARRAFTLSAAAVLLAAVVAALGLENGDPGRDIGTADGSVSADATRDATGPGGARAAALGWIDILAKGDMRAAWDGLGPASQAAWESFDAFEGARASFAEGLAQWASAERLDVTSVRVRTDPEGALHVVTFSGERRVLGNVVDSAYAVVVRETSPGSYELEPFTPQGTIGLQFLRPDPGDRPATWSSGDPVVVAVPDGRTDAALVVDGNSDPVAPVATGDQAPEGVELSHLPDGGWGPGRHVVTAFAVYADGTPAATAVVLQVP